MGSYRLGWVGNRGVELRVAFERARRKLQPAVRRTLPRDLSRELEELEERMARSWRPSDLAFAEDVYRRYSECVDVALLVAPEFRVKIRRRLVVASLTVITLSLLGASLARAKHVRRAPDAIQTRLVEPPLVGVFEAHAGDGCALHVRLHNPLEQPCWFILPAQLGRFRRLGDIRRELALPDSRMAVELEPGAHATVGRWAPLTASEDFNVVVVEGGVSAEIAALSRHSYPPFNDPDRLNELLLGPAVLLAAKDEMRSLNISIAPQQIWRSPACLAH